MKSNKQVKAMQKDILPQIIRYDEPWDLDWFNGNPFVEEVRYCNVTQNEYWYYEPVLLGTVSIKANQEEV